MEVPCPIWDTEENKHKFDLMRQSTVDKCGCKKNECNPGKKLCKCVRKGSLCTSLCICVGCKNNTREIIPDQATSQPLDDDESLPSETTTEEESDFEDNNFAVNTDHDNVA